MEVVKTMTVRVLSSVKMKQRGNGYIKTEIVTAAGIFVEEQTF